MSRAYITEIDWPKDLPITDPKVPEIMASAEDAWVRMLAQSTKGTWVPILNRPPRAYLVEELTRDGGEPTGTFKIKVVGDCIPHTQAP